MKGFLRGLVRLCDSFISLWPIAEGKCYLYYERDIKIWEVAAGMAIVEAAGGYEHRFASTTPSCLTIFSANQHLWRFISKYAEEPSSSKVKE